MRPQCACVAPTMLEELCIKDPTLLGYASAITEQIKEILRVVSSKVLLVSNFAQQLPTTRNNMYQCVQKDATYDNQQCCIRLQGA